MKVTLAVTGPFSDVNLGDYAMLINNLSEIEPTEVVVFSYDESFSNKVTKDYFENARITVCPVKLDSERVQNISEHTQPDEIISMVLNKDELLAHLKSMGRLLVNGGGYFNSLWFKRHRRERLCQIFAPILIASAYGIPVTFSGNSYGPFEDSDIPFFESMFSFIKPAIFGSRDSLLSPLWSRKVGIPPERLECITDDLFPISSSLFNKAKKFHNPEVPYMVFETYLPTEYIQENKKLFINFFRFIQESLGLKVVLLPFHVGHGGVEQAKLIRSWDKRIDIVDISEVGYLPISDAFEFISNSRFVISCRYHALVFAAQAKTPIFSIMRDVMGSKSYYFNKNYGFLELALGRHFEPSVFLYNSYEEAFTAAENELDSVLLSQKRLYSEYLAEGIQAASRKRIQFFKNFLRD